MFLKSSTSIFANVGHYDVPTTALPIPITSSVYPHIKNTIEKSEQSEKSVNDIVAGMKAQYGEAAFYEDKDMDEYDAYLPE
jgi:hypothetical protein